MTPARRQCVRCVMDESDPEIVFDAKGRCNHCAHLLSMKRSRLDGERLFDAAVERIRADGARGRYDCVIGLSGGVDSSYVAYLMVSRGLRPLAVHLDNGWDTDVAARNMKRIVDALGIDYESHVLDWEEFRALQLAFLRASVPEIETPTDIAIIAALHRTAARHGIRHIVTGGNMSTEGILPKAWHYDAKDARYLRAVHARFATRPLRTFPTLDYLEEARFKLVDRIQITYALNLVPFDKEAAIALLSERFGWRRYGGKHHESRFTAFVQSYVLPEKFGIDYRRALLSSQICYGLVTREAALELLARPPFDAEKLPADKDYVARKLGIGLGELDEILALPAKTHRDYPNDQRFLEALYAGFRVARGALRLARWLAPSRR